MHSVRFYFDFLSPYASLALLRADDVGARHDIRWEPRPVLLAGILDANKLPGGAEVPAKRKYVCADAVRVAAEHGIELRGAPAHPFLSLTALRVAILFLDEPQAFPLCVALARACWSEGRDLTDFDVLREVVASVGLDGSDVERRILERSVKRRLKAFTDEAIELGAFGLPTFEWEGELFWGQDRMEQLADRIHGRLPSPRAMAAELLERPVGIERRSMT